MCLVHQLPAHCRLLCSDFTLRMMLAFSELSQDICSQCRNRCTVTTAPGDGTQHPQLQPASAGTDKWVLSWRLNEESYSSGDQRTVGSRFQVLGLKAYGSRTHITPVLLMSKLMLQEIILRLALSFLCEFLVWIWDGNIELFVVLGQHERRSREIHWRCFSGLWHQISMHRFTVLVCSSYVTHIALLVLCLCAHYLG